MSTVNIPLDKAELLSVLLEAILYGKTLLTTKCGQKVLIVHGTRFLVVDVRRNDLDAVVPTVHSPSEP